MANQLELWIEVLSGARGAIREFGDLADKMEDFGEESEDSEMSVVDLNQAVELAEKVFGALGSILDGTIGKMIDYGMEVKDTGMMLGVSAEEASTLIQVMDDLRVDMGTLKLAFKTMKDEGMAPTLETLMELSAEYLNIQDPVERTQFLFKKFGRAGLEVQRIMEAGPEVLEEYAGAAKETGLVVGEGFVAQAEAGRMAVDQLQDQWGGFTMMLASEMLPGITAALGGFNGLFRQILISTGAMDDYSEATEEAWTKQEELNFELAQASPTYEDYGQAVTEAGLLLMAYTEEEWAAQRSTVALTEAVESQTAVMGLLDGAVGALSMEFDAQKTTMDLVGDGLDLLTQDYLEQQQILAVLALAQGEITAAQFAERMEIIDSLEPLQELNAAYEAGTIDRYEWIAAMSDGVVTQEEVNTLLGRTTDELSDIEAKIMGIDGMVANAEVNIDINSTGGGGGGGSTVNVYMAKGGSFWADKPTTMTVGEGGEPEYVQVTPASRMVGGGNSSTVNNYYNQTINTSAQYEQVAADFEAMKAWAR